MYRRRRVIWPSAISNLVPRSAKSPCATKRVLHFSFITRLHGWWLLSVFLHFFHGSTLSPPHGISYAAGMDRRTFLFILVFNRHSILRIVGGILCVYESLWVVNRFSEMGPRSGDLGHFASILREQSGLN